MEFFINLFLPNLSATQWYIYFHSIRIQTWVLSQSLGVYRSFPTIRFFMQVLCKTCLCKTCAYSERNSYIYQSDLLPKPKGNICLIFKIKQKVPNELSSISRSNTISRSNSYLEIEYSIYRSNWVRSNIRSRNSNLICRSNIRSRDSHSICSSNIRSWDSNLIYRWNIRSRDSNSVCRWNIRSRDSNSIYRWNIRSPDTTSICRSNIWSRDSYSIYRSNIRSRDIIRSTDGIFDLAIIIRFADGIQFIWYFSSQMKKYLRIKFDSLYIFCLILKIKQMSPLGFSNL